MKTLLFLGIFSTMIIDSSPLIFDFNKGQDINGWYVVNDGVMGGLSQGTFELNVAGHGLFKGSITTENNGGFSSIRYVFSKKDVSEFTHIVLKVKGDGSPYQFRIKESQRDRHSFIANFETTGAWETIKIPLHSFYPGFRGYKINIPNYSGLIMKEIGILRGNKKDDKFSLEIDSIYLN